MITKKPLRTIDEIQQIQRLATAYPEPVGIRSDDGNIIIDVKSYIGVYATDFRKLIHIVTESKEFHQVIRDTGETLQE